MTANFPGIEIGKELDNGELTSIFQCSPQGGMRRSLRTNALVIVSDHTKPDYIDTWKGKILHYTGMGQTGDQDINFLQNKTLKESNSNGVRVYLFEVFSPGKYCYQGQVKLAGEPYQAEQMDVMRNKRKVWMFPLARINDERAIKKEPVGQVVLEEDFLKVQLVEETQARQLSLNELQTKIKKGSEEPKVQQVLSKRFERDAIVAEIARRNAKGKCQLCNNAAPFITKDNVPFLEVHHIEWLSRGGKDSVANTVALCPNCHRKMHLLDLERDKALLRDRAIKLIR